MQTYKVDRQQESKIPLKVIEKRHLAFDNLKVCWCQISVCLAQESQLGINVIYKVAYTRDLFIYFIVLASQKERSDLMKDNDLWVQKLCPVISAGNNLAF